MQPFPHIAIYGLGRLGKSLLAALRSGATPVRGGGRTQGVAALLHELPPGSLVMLSVPDDAIAATAARFAACPGAAQFQYVHGCGAWGPTLLQPLSDGGAQVGAFHILQSFPTEGGAARIAGSWCAIDGPAALRDSLHALALSLAMHPFHLPEAARPAYHAAAVVASNALVALLGLSRQIARDGGIDAAAATQMLLPLVRGTLDNVEQLGIGPALTGPVARGDSNTLRRHIAHLADGLTGDYRAVMELTIGFALQAGRITPEQAAGLLDALR